MARTMTGDPEESMDVVQDTMFRFVRRYARRPEQEWRPLFFRILVNRSRDFQRRRAVRSRVMNWFHGDDWPDPVDSARGPRTDEPAVEVAGQEAMAALERAMAGLPDRQREAFVLRCLEGMNVAETAEIMGCSDGSVKTHYSRALSALRGQLGDHYDG
jgi:RNA polymerase sigma-70 factor (ECF subfamily)